MARIKWRRCRGWCLSAFDKLGTLLILITSFGEFILYFIVIFLFYFHFIKKKKVVAGLFLGCPAFAAGIHFQWIKNSEGKQSSTGSVENLTMIKWKRENNIVNI